MLAVVRNPAPLQARSERTLARLEAAAIRLLETRTWADLKLTDLVAEARSSIGSFYNLFGDKDGLLDHLDERYAQEVMGHVDRWLAQDHPDLEAAAHDLFAGLVRFHRQRHGLIRALVLRARTLREPAYDERTRRMNTLQPAICSHLHARCPQQSSASVMLAFSFAFSALRDRVLFPESIQLAEPLSDQALVAALTRLFCSFLGSHPTGGRR